MSIRIAALLGLAIAAPQLVRALNLVASCSISATSVPFAIGDVSMTEMDAIGKFSGWQTGRLTSNGCAGVSTVTMRFAGTAASEAGYTYLFQPTRSNAGVGIELEAVSVPAGRITPNATKVFSPAASGSGWDFRVRLVRKRNTYTPGAANATITMTFTYA